MWQVVVIILEILHGFIWLLLSNLSKNKDVIKSPLLIKSLKLPYAVGIYPTTIVFKISDLALLISSLSHFLWILLSYFWNVPCSFTPIGASLPFYEFFTLPIMFSPSFPALLSSSLIPNSSPKAQVQSQPLQDELPNSFPFYMFQGTLYVLTLSLQLR